MHSDRVITVHRLRPRPLCVCCSPSLRTPTTSAGSGDTSGAIHELRRRLRTPATAPVASASSGDVSYADCQPPPAPPVLQVIPQAFPAPGAPACTRRPSRRPLLPLPPASAFQPSIAAARAAIAAAPSGLQQSRRPPPELLQLPPAARDTVGATRLPRTSRRHSLPPQASPAPRSSAFDGSFHLRT